MDDFYTSFTMKWDNILLSGYSNGKKFNRKIPIKPYLFIQSKEESEYKTTDNKNVSRVDFDSVKEAREFIKSYEGVNNVSLYGLQFFHYVHIYDKYKSSKFNRNLIRILNWDIETDSQDGYGDIQTANKEIVSISMKMMGEKDIYVFGFKDYTPQDTEVLRMINDGYKIHYKKCADEKELLRSFIKLWEKLSPDVITGYNISLFDIPYTIKRIRQVLSNDNEKRLSPFGIIEESKVELYGKENDKYDIVGIPVLDYLDTIKKFSFKNFESYSLDFISSEILGVGKLDYKTDYGSLANLYMGRMYTDKDTANDMEGLAYNKISNSLSSIKEIISDDLSKMDVERLNVLLNSQDEKVLGVLKHEARKRAEQRGFNTFLDYNILDIVRVEQLEERLKYFNIVFSIAYLSKTNYTDSYTTIRTWDILIHNYLMDRKIVVPLTVKNKKEKQIAGGYVKDPHTGKHNWVCSYDFTSLYPHLCMTFNISPETYRGIIRGLGDDTTVDKILSGELSVLRDKLIERDMNITGKGSVFIRDKIGFVPALMSEFFNVRKSYQKEEENYDKLLADVEEEIFNRSKGKSKKKEFADVSDDKLVELSEEYSSKIVEYSGASQAYKILLNSLYGALSNEYMRWYSDEVAESITLSGQLAIRWVEKHVNLWMNGVLKTENVDYVVAIDTDSVYINVSEFVNQFYKGNEPEDPHETTDVVMKFSQRLHKEIQNCLESLYETTNAFDKKLFMNPEAIGSAIWIAKKRYAMLIHSFKGVKHIPSKLKIQGLEIVRSSTPAVCRKYLKDAIPLSFERTPDKVKKFVSEFSDKFLTLPFEDISFPRGVNDLEKYVNNRTIYKDATPIHVRASLLYNHLIKERGLQNKLTPIRSGDKIRFCYLTMPNPLNENVIAMPDNIPHELSDIAEFLDRNKQLQKAFIEPIKRITDAANLNIDDNIDISQFFT